MGKLTSINPSDNTVIGEIEMSNADEIKTAVDSARAAQPAWAALSVAERRDVLKSFAEISKSRAEEIAQLISQETGRPINNTRSGNVQGGLEYLEAYLDMAEHHLAPVVTHETDSVIHEVIREPWGVVACICPWNYPYMNVVWQCIPPLLAGNTVVYKNSEENPLFAKLMAELFEQSELPAGVFNVVYGDGQVGDELVHQAIDMISFTGSAQVGQQLARIAAEKFIPILAELGGSSPAIVFEDRTIEKGLAKSIFDKRFLHSGQICGAIKRLMVYESGFDRMVELLAEISAEQKLGDARDETTDLGPLVAERQVVKIEEQVQDAIDKGAKVICGGKRLSGLEGAYYEPTILTDITPDMRVWHEETFGPVLPVISYKTEAEAIKLANDTDYGLGAHVFTNDNELFKRVAAQLESAMVAQNDVNYFNPNSPFGGYKKSGIGRLHGQYGFDEVTQPKLIARNK
ncbi:MAG TPA: aldehyde dehydrogenase family protein [Candidatus Dormibacteraeota bacterium]|nr:aldehyde dehydrogenase family protein [Candidatus Dormibacteraeota bacterium]